MKRSGFWLSAILAGVLAASGGIATGSRGSGHTSLSGTLDCIQLEHLWEAAGGASSEAFLAAEVATAESSGEQYARDPKAGTYTNGTADWGYWQVNTVNGGSSASYDPMTNAREAVAISRDGTDWYPWITWRKDLEVGEC